MNGPVCNKQVEQGSNFCPNCGFNFRTNKPYNNQSSDKSSTILKWLLIFVIAFFSVGLIIAGTISFFITEQVMK